MNPRPRPGRRRVLSLIAAACGMPLPLRASGRAAVWAWQGDAFGAPASLRIAHPDREIARRLASSCVAELRRLEASFSLYRTQSEISRLNRDGRLDHPSLDFLALMRIAQDWSTRTDGAFDATVQPLWQLHADHFAAAAHDPRGPSEAQRRAARVLVDHRAVDISRRRIAFAKPGMAVTLNGIAQGYATDRAVERLRDAGIASTLVEMGEIAAIGDGVDGTPWTVGIPGDDGKLAMRIDLADRAVATSAGRATPFDRSRRFHHLFDPHSGTCANAIGSVSVVAGDATTADALSTALFVTPPGDAPALLHRACGGRAPVDVLIEHVDGNLSCLSTCRESDRRPLIPSTTGAKT